MIKTVKISKVNVGEPKTGQTNGKDWKAWAVGICVDDVWHNAFLFDKDFVDELGVSDEMTLDFYEEEYQGKPQNKFKQVTKNDIISMRLDALEKKVFGKVTEQTTTKPEQEPEKPEPKSKFPPLVQAKWDEFDKCLEENKDVKDYKKVRTWLDGLKDPTTKVLTEQLSKLKETLNPKSESKYSSHHESLITACCDTLKTKDRLPVIQTLDNMVKAWKIEGTEELSDTSENQCLNLLEEFDKQQVAEQDDNLPF